MKISFLPTFSFLKRITHTVSGVNNRNSIKQKMVNTSVFFLFTFLLSYWVEAQTLLIPVSGADGVFSTLTINGQKVYQSAGTTGNYAPYIYLQTSKSIVNQTVYLELRFLDIGYGMVGVDYNSNTQDYQQVNGKNSFLLDSKGEKTMVFELKNAYFRNAQNLNSDLRIYSDTHIQKHLISAIIYEQPTELWKEWNENYFTTYQGRKYQGSDIVNSRTLDGKLICGYQGWFRVPGDPSSEGWVHYFRDQHLSQVTVEMWPDMEEYSTEERYPVPGWTLKDGSPAILFSSANKRTVLRHFQWMQAYGIHGVAVQRFAAGLYPGHSNESYRIPAYVREAANRTGRTFYIMYDQSGLPGDLLVDYISKDWKILVDSMNITQDERYLKHNGKPVVSIFGYWPERFSPQDARKLAAIFKQPGYEAHIIGSGQYIAPENTAWNVIYDDFLAYFPWNVGNYTSLDLDNAFVYTGQWPSEKSFLENKGVTFMPLIFPGFGWDNLMKQPPGTTRFGRRKGEVMWKEVKDAIHLGVKAVYIAMFDEIDESTAIFKISNNIPVNHYFTTNEDLPSDFYLNLTGYAAAVVAGEKALPEVMPDFSKMSQPPITDVIYPAHEDTIFSNSPNDIIWSAVKHNSGIEEYQVNLDGQLFTIQGENTKFPISLKKGKHTVSVRAKNGLKNYGGWSEVNEFFLSDATTGISDSWDKNDAFTIFPNPATGHVYILSNTELNSLLRIDIISASGELLTTIQANSNHIADINLLELKVPSSMIIAKIYHTGGYSIKKIIIQK